MNSTLQSPSARQEESGQTNRMIAVSKAFARAYKTMSTAELQLFLLAVSKFDWKNENSNEIELDKIDTVKWLGINSNPTDLTQNLRRSIGMLTQHSWIEIAEKDKHLYESGQVICYMKIDRYSIKLRFTPEFLPMFSDLYKSKGEFITLWLDDMMQMSSYRSIILYEHLRLLSDTRKLNHTVISTIELKKLLNIPWEGRGAYLQPDGKFNRTMFEKGVLQPIVDDLLKCKMIELVQYDGRYWKKRMNNKYHTVDGYEFTYKINQSVTRTDDVA